MSIHYYSGEGSPLTLNVFLGMVAGAACAYPLYIAGLVTEGYAFLLWMVLSFGIGCILGIQSKVREEREHYVTWEGWFKGGETLEAYRQRTGQKMGRLVCDTCGNPENNLTYMASAYEGAVSQELFKLRYQALWHYRTHRCTQCGKELWRSRADQ
jgi:hypothetical protein